MPGPELDVAVIGGGILGLATAMELSGRYAGLGVVVLEKEGAIARHQTGHNSGVIHSGLYYRPGSAKAAMALRGAHALMAFCDEHGVAYERCGKVVVATVPAEIPALEELERRGCANGVPDLTMIGSGQLRELEPHAAGVRALHVPATAIVDFAAVAAQFRQVLEARGGEVRLTAAVTGIAMDGPALRITTARGGLRVRYAINCAGLFADRVSALAAAPSAVRIVPFRGEYYSLRPQRRDLVRNLIYPVPDPALPFLGGHFTRRMDGSVEAGPNAVLAFKREGYRRRDFSLRDTADTLRYPGFWRLARRYWRVGLGEMYRSVQRAAFVATLRRLVPDLRAADLRPAPAGVRAQALAPDGMLLEDFQIVESERMIHLLNAPSPGATASLSLAEEIADRAAHWFGPVRPAVV